jgi:hypothetical protein
MSQLTEFLVILIRIAISYLAVNYSSVNAARVIAAAVVNSAYVVVLKERTVAYFVDSDCVVDGCFSYCCSDYWIIFFGRADLASAIEHYYPEIHNNCMR